MNGPSEKAIEAAVQADCDFVSPFFLGSDPEETKDRWREGAVRHMSAAHDPALGLDRSVCLRSLLDGLRDKTQFSSNIDEGYCGHRIADFIEREFGGEA